jgi:hypothetical protein
MSDTVQSSTAQVLGKFRKELLEEGIPFDVADDLVRAAASMLIDNALVVKE